MDEYDSIRYHPQQQYNNMPSMGFAPTAGAPMGGTGYVGNTDILDDLFSRQTENQGWRDPTHEPYAPQQPAYGHGPGPGGAQWTSPSGGPPQSQPQAQPPRHPLPPSQEMGSIPPFPLPNERYPMMGAEFHRGDDLSSFFPPLPPQQQQRQQQQQQEPPHQHYAPPPPLPHAPFPSGSGNTTTQLPTQNPSAVTNLGRDMMIPPPHTSSSTGVPSGYTTAAETTSVRPLPPQGSQPPSGANNYYYYPVHKPTEAFMGETQPAAVPTSTTHLQGQAPGAYPGAGSSAYFPEDGHSRFVDPQSAAYAPPPPSAHAVPSAAALLPYAQAGRYSAATLSPPPPPPVSIPVVGSGGYAHETLAAVLAANAQVGAQAARQKTQEEEDREQLEKIIRMRKELEQEEERERELELEKETWGCPTCTFRNPLPVTNCDMCGTPNPRSPPTTVSMPQGSAQPQRLSAVRAENGSGGGSDTKVDIWDCTRCLTRNGGGSQCVVCGTKRQSAGTSSTHNRHPSPPARAALPWRCSVCSHVNGPSKSNCEVCNGYQRNGIPVEGDYPAANHASQNRGAAPPTSSAASAIAETPTMWNCSVCTLENSVRNAVCSACESGQRPRHLAPPREGKHRSKHGSDRDGSSKATESKHHTSGTSPSTWNCPVCTFINSSKNSKCDMCGTRWAGNPHQQDEKQKKREEQSDEEEEIMWQEDHLAKSCNKCQSDFGLIRRRHHCRACGFVFCASCSPFHAPLKKDGPPVRLCVNCYTARQGGRK